MITPNPIVEILKAPLDPHWTIEGLTVRVLDAIATQTEDRDIVVDAATLSDRQSLRLIRPLLACLANMSATETSLYGGTLTFRRGTACIRGQFENQPGRIVLALRRFDNEPLEGTGDSSSPSTLKPLSDVDRDLFLSALDGPPKPATESLKKAVATTRS